MNMKELFLAVIRKGGYDLNTMVKRIHEYHINGSLTDKEHDDLLAAARGEATPGVDAADEVQKLWAAIHELTARVTALEGGTAEDEGDAQEVPDYVPPTGAHDAYYNGALVRYNGVVYKCVVAAGVACVWSPDVMPDFWEAV